MGLFSDFAHLLYPNLCISCGASLLSQEELICLTCIHDKLTKTNFHLVKGNPVEKLLHGRCRVEKASAFYYFGKAGVVQNLLHQIKYKGVKEAAEKVGKLYGYALKDTNAFSTADYIIPVPLHKKKERKRGFNQSEYFGNGLSETLEIPMMTENLIRTKETETQTKKSRYNRYENVADIFEVLSPEKLHGKEILLVDDVITTGATLEACINGLTAKCKDIKVNVAAIAFPN